MKRIKYKTKKKKKKDFFHNKKKKKKEKKPPFFSPLFVYIIPRLLRNFPKIVFNKLGYRL